MTKRTRKILILFGYPLRKKWAVFAANFAWPYLPIRQAGWGLGDDDGTTVSDGFEGR